MIMKRFKSFAIITAMSLLIATISTVAPIGMVSQIQVAQASGTYYVSPSGTSSWPSCTSNSPCSLQTAATNADDGDIVLLKDGTYSGQLIPSNSGSSGNPITFKADHEGLAILQGDTSYTYSSLGGLDDYPGDPSFNPNHLNPPVLDEYHPEFIIKIRGKSYITLDGLKLATQNEVMGLWIEVNSNDRRPMSYDGALSTTVKSTNITIQNCIFSGIGAGWGYRSPATFFNVEQIKLLKNVFTDSHSKGSFGSGGDMVTFSRAKQVLIEGNDFSKSNHSPLNFAYSSHPTLGDFETIENVVIRNNILNSQWSRG